MIDVVKLYNRQNEVSKNGTTGYSDQDDFNDRLYVAQFEIAEILCDNYERNQKVKDALSEHVISADVSVVSGQLTKPTDYLRGFEVWPKASGNIFPATEININEVSMYATSYVRKPDLAKKQVYYYFLNNKYNFLPGSSFDATLVYCKKPVPATITLTESSTDNSDFLTPTGGTNLAWPENLFNLFLYSMLEKLGMEMKDNLVYEYGLLGIQLTTNKLTTTA